MSEYSFFESNYNVYPKKDVSLHPEKKREDIPKREDIQNEDKNTVIRCDAADRWRQGLCRTSERG
jgi:hypothetical protein